MPNKQPQILIVEDDEAALFGYEKNLKRMGYAVYPAASLLEAKRILFSSNINAVLLDLKLPDGDSLEWIPDIKKSHPLVPVIVITGVSDIPTAVKATKYGAENFLTKPVDMVNLTTLLEKSLELQSIRRHNLVHQRTLKKEDPYFGTSPAIEQLMEHAKVAAASDSVIFLQGETGTGKGVLARWIHAHSDRAGEEFVELNCSSLTGDLLRSELFGHVKGAFTSAIKDKEGLLEIAHNGTLFLDEIGDMDMEIQAQLLKTIEERSFRRLGENRVRQSDFRLICATNRELLKDVDSGRFRKDLYYRVCVFPLLVAPLRERADDIPGIVENIAVQFGFTHLPLSDETVQILKRYSWPGNVRELRNMFERAMLLSRGNPLEPVHFPGLALNATHCTVEKETQNLDTVVFAHIHRVLEKFDGDKNKTCKALGISLSSLYRRLEKIQKKGE